MINSILLAGIFFISFLQVMNTTDLNAQNTGLKYDDRVYQKDIKTVLLHREGWELSYPIIELNEEENILELSFDDLGSDRPTYSYTIIHCDAEWNGSNLAPSEYIDGFISYDVLDYNYSFNTYMNYTHYTLKIPNENTRLKLSGNYVIKVYQDYDEDNIVLTKRFTVVETMVSIAAEVRRPVMTKYRNTSQQVNFDINYEGVDIADPITEVKIAIVQNNRWETAITNLKPLFYRNNSLDYTYQEGNIFPGLREFRYFDIKSVRYVSEKVKEISFSRPFYHAYLYPISIPMHPKYFFDNDLNGKYLVDIQEEQNSALDADYLHVHFTLEYPAPELDGGIYVMGNLSNWNTTQENKMNYNFETKSYELDLLLKQGYYDYLFGYLPNNADFADIAFLEGSSYETENDYLIYVYYRGYTSRFDRLIGVEIINTLNEQDERQF